MKGHDLEMEYRMRRAQNTMKDLREKAAFRLEAYELALTDLKLKQNLHIERTMMTNSELESKIMNATIPDHQVDTLVKECEEGLVLRHTA